MYDVAETPFAPSVSNGTTVTSRSTPSVGALLLLAYSTPRTPIWNCETSRPAGSVLSNSTLCLSAAMVVVMPRPARMEMTLALTDRVSALPSWALVRSTSTRLMRPFWSNRVALLEAM